MGKKKEKQNNDELLYDDQKDDEDSKWVENTFGLPPELQSETSDAILSCSSCFSLLTIDCQKHETFSNQFRAMFVTNCKIVKDEIISYKNSSHATRLPNNDEKLQLTEDLYFPVVCEVCSVEVAVYDEDEMYHFHNVFPS